MRLQNTGSANDAADEIFMTFAPGTQTNNDDRPSTPDADASNETFDDVFGSAPSSPTLETSHISPRETTTRRAERDPSDIPRLRSVHVTAGYREGLSASKEQHVQAGFDEGFSLGAELGMKVGWILGVLEGVARALAAGGGDDDDGGGGGGQEVMSKEGMQAEVARAEEELSMRCLFAEEFFGGDGVWIYPVPAAEREGEENVTFAEVAKAHPRVVEWERRTMELADRLGLPLS